MKISDNNIENIYNINIYINGVFSNDIQSDIVTVLGSLMNQQSVSAGGANGLSMKDLVKKSASNDIDLNIPASSLLTPAQQNMNLDGLARKIQEALTVQSNQGNEALLPSSLEAKANDLLQQFKTDKL